MNDIVEFEGITFDSRHGGAFDRGTADSYYGRGMNPHLFVGATYSTRRIEQHEMRPEEIVAYAAGYFFNQIRGGRKGRD